MSEIVVTQASQSFLPGSKMITCYLLNANRFSLCLVTLRGLPTTWCIKVVQKKMYKIFHFGVVAISLPCSLFWVSQWYTMYSHVCYWGNTQHFSFIFNKIPLVLLKHLGCHSPCHAAAVNTAFQPSTQMSIQRATQLNVTQRIHFFVN